MYPQPDHNSTYRRGQLEYALWKVFSGGASSEVPHAFALRIKKLIDLDRAEHGKPAARVFSGVAGAEQGKDAEYTAFDAFCMALGVDLTDMGFKQGEVLFMLRHLRQQLETEYKRILRHPLIMHNIARSEDFPDLPTTEIDGRQRADQAVYLVFRNQELNLRDQKRASAPLLILDHKFLRGCEDLKVYLRDNLLGTRKAVVIELAEMAHLVVQNLREAPIIKRGRK